MKNNKKNIINSKMGGYVNEGMTGSQTNLNFSTTTNDTHILQNNNDNNNNNNNNNDKSNDHHADQQSSFDFILVGEPGDDNKSNSSVFKSVFDYATHRIKKGCTKKMLHKRLPILRWLPKYNKDDAVGDLVAGITVGLTVIPQSLAYSRVAGLPAQYGLYGSFLGCLLYILFGSSKDIAFGPSAIVSLLTYQTLSHLNEGTDRIHHAILLCLLSGFIELLMGIFGLGFVIDFVSGPVSSGFTSAVALIIVSSQMKDILGIKAEGSTFIKAWKSILSEIHNYSIYDAVLGMSCIIILLILRRMAAIKIGPNQEELRNTKHRVFTKLIWLFGTSRNAILVIVCGIIGYNYGTTDITSPFKIIGNLHSGMPDVLIPSFGYSNGTNEFTIFDMIENLGSGLFVIPLISLMEDISVCKAFGNGQPVDATQELIALGVSNIGCSFVQSFPGTGSLSRGAVNNASGVRTPFGGFYTGILVILALLFLTPWFGYIPRACLAAIIIAAVIFMVEIKVIKPMWRTKKSDLLPGIATFIACLTLQLEIGILVGISVNVIFILYHAARPKISLEKLRSRCGVEYLMLTPDRCLIFPSVDYVRNLVTKYGRCAGNTPVVLDCSYIYGADYTAAIVIESLTKDFAQRGQPLFFYNLKPSVYSVFEGVEPTDFVVYYTEEALDDLLKERGYITQVKSNPSIA